MPSMILPSYRRGPTLLPGPLRAFWLIVSAGVGLLTASSAVAVTGRRRMSALALPLALVIATLGLRQPERILGTYRRWNGLARRARHVGRTWASGVAMAGLVAGRRLGGPVDVPLGPVDVSGWLPRSSQPPNAYPYQDLALHGDASGSAFEHYRSARGRSWAEGVRAPYLLLRALEADIDPQAPPPANVYTLY